MVTMKDVARKANVGIATVSRVLNKSGFVSEDTRKIVEKAIDELGYIPNELARNFQRKKSNIIAVIVPEVKQPFTINLITAIEHYLRDNGYILMLGSSSRDTDIEIEYIDKLKSQSVAGIIITAPLSKQFNNLDYPIVSFDRNLGNNIPYVYTKNYEGGKYLTNLLLKNKCKNLAFIDFGADKKSLSNRRRLAFKDICSEKDIPYQIFIHKQKNEDKRDYLERIFEEVITYDGIVFSCDNYAKIFVSLCAKNKIEIPKDIQIVSYDAINDYDLYHPKLTSIGHDFPLIAKTLIDLIFKRMNNNEFKIENELDYIIKQGETIKHSEEKIY